MKKDHEKEGYDLGNSKGNPLVYSKICYYLFGIDFFVPLPPTILF
jgi:hypothetical protein